MMVMIIRHDNLKIMIIYNVLLINKLSKLLNNNDNKIIAYRQKI